MFADFYRNKRVLVTGHSGFKGGWLSLWLKHLGASVYGLGLGPPTEPNIYEVIRAFAFDGEIRCDVRRAADLKTALAEAAPNLIFHLAAQPLVRQSFEQPVETFETNALGTLNLLQAILELELPSTVIVVTTDKCYENRGWDYGYREEDSLGGQDVYSASKAAAEIIVQAWRKAFFALNPRLGQIATARAGNVIGGGDYARDRIVPDCVKALLAQQPILVRNPLATRPWQHVLESLSGYLWLGALLAQAGKNTPLASSFNFGPGVQANVSVSALAEEILKTWPGRWEQVSETGAPPEAQKLNLAVDKAFSLLNWCSTWSFQETVQHTMAWYYRRHIAQKSDLVEFSLGQIECFAQAARKKGAVWASAHQG